MKKLLTIFMILFFFACGAPAKKHDIVNYGNFGSDFDAVWSAVIKFFATNNIPIKTIEKDSGIIYAEPQIFPEEWIDCGKPYMLEVFGETEGSFNVFVNEDENDVSVQITTAFSVSVWIGNDFKENRICYSTGAFEKSLLDYVEINFR